MSIYNYEKFELPIDLLGPETLLLPFSNKLPKKSLIWLLMLCFASPKEVR